MTVPDASHAPGGPGPATPSDTPPSSGLWTKNHYFCVIGAIIGPVFPYVLGITRNVNDADMPRPSRQPGVPVWAAEGPSGDYVVLARCKLVDRRTRLQGSPEGGHSRGFDHYPVNEFISLKANSEAGVDMVAQGPLKQSGSVPARQRFGTRPLSDDERFLLAVHQKTQRNPDSPFQVKLFATTTYESLPPYYVSSLDVHLELELELRWTIQPQLRALPVQERTLRDRILKFYFPDARQQDDVAADQQDGGHAHASPQAFYEAAHVTSKNDPENENDDDDNDDIVVPGLATDLFPFQRRAVKWLLKRESVCWSSSSIIPYTAPHDPDLTSHFVVRKDIDGGTFYLSSILGAVTRDPYAFQQANDDAARGGILSEEMGLGKTVEMIALILLHPRPQADETGQAGQAGGTLILAPSALKTQWVDELQRHAPHLRVMVYNGMAKSCRSKEEEAAMVEQFCTHDVVVATYNDLRSEIHFATDPPARNMRKRTRDGGGGDNDDNAAEARYRPRSPLVQLTWWRVCLDEAQEIESGVSNVTALAHLIPRINSWGVTGTPVKNNINDLWALLMFVRYHPYGTIRDCWKQLVKNQGALFKTVFGRVALRHTKRIVRDELTIPPQKRFVIKVPFTAVEEQHYESLFERLTQACMLNTDGTPIADNWSPDNPGILSAMQNALSRLRMACLHPDLDGTFFNRQQQQKQQQHGPHGPHGQKAAPMRTVVEVLDAMIEQSESALTVDRRALLAHKLKRGQLLENSPRAKEALAIWQKVLEECKALVDEARDKVQVETQRAEALARVADEEEEDDDDEDDDDNEDGNAAGGRLGEAQRELRYALQLLHKAEFFCANGYFQVKSNAAWTAPGSDAFRALEQQEVESYERAKRIRREILSESLAKALRRMQGLQRKAAAQGFAEIPECQFAKPAGIEGRRTGEDLDRLAVVLSNQAAQMDVWREALVQLLLKDLVDDDADEDEEDKKKEKEATGDEYEDSTKVQDEINVYMTILKAGISDRKFFLTGVTRSILAWNEEYQALRMAKDGEGPAPALMLKVFEEREQSILPPGEEGGGADAVRSLRACVVDLRESSTRLRGQQTTIGAGAGIGSSLHGVTSQRAAMELACVETQLKSAQAEQTRQLKAVAALEKELDEVRHALNARIAYYRQLQIVSDMVAPYEGAKDDEAMEALEREEQRLARKLTLAESKHRYLTHLKEIDAAQDSQLCVICQSSFTVGVLTICGHQFCKECMNFWFAAHQNCPLCKRQLSRDNLHDITFKTREIKVMADHGGGKQAGLDNGPSGSGSGSNRAEQDGQAPPQIYETFSKDKVAEIMDIDLPGQSFTTKVDTLVRHLLWLRAADPGAKSIVFSQYTPFLHILAAALDHYNISHTSYARRGGIEQFRTDPNVECFLLHARAHASGLNLVVASHVLLCEPLLHTAIELQAIARVHRIGQRHKTTVWLFLVEGTVEEAVHALSVERRMAHIGGGGAGKGKGKGKEDSAAADEMLDDRLEVANSMELEHAEMKTLLGKDRAQGETVDKNDLWVCLFGKRPQQQRPRTAGRDEALQMDPGFRRLLTAEAAEQRLEGGSV